MMPFSHTDPTALYGPSLGPELSSGFELLKKILDGSMKAIPDIDLGIVDVRSYRRAFFGFTGRCPFIASNSPPVQSQIRR